MYLLDTVVVSEAMKRRPDTAVTAWLGAQEAAGFFVSVVTLGEIQRGISAERPRNPAFAERLQEWMGGLCVAYTERLLPVSREIALRWGELAARLGNDDGYDLMIAATALQHDLTVATRNTRHFVGTGVRVVNPFEP